MIITQCERKLGEWEVIGSLGERLTLPAATGGPFTIGLLGTRSVAQVKGKTKTEALAETLAELDKPVCLVDVRRDGVGSQSSWSPRELASLVPIAMRKWSAVHRKEPQPYGFWHLPCLAPSIELLGLWRKAMEPFRKVARLEQEIARKTGSESSSEAYDKLRCARKELDEHASEIAVDDIPSVVEEVRVADVNERSVPVAAFRHWEVFKAMYLRQLPGFAVDAACAFVEMAQVRGGVAVFMCAEEYCSNFEGLLREAQDDAYCHRYTLASAVARAHERGIRRP